MVRNLPAMQEIRVRFLGWEDPLEKGMAIHSSILAWRKVWWAIVHGAAKSRTRLNNTHTHTHTHTVIRNKWYNIKESQLPLFFKDL